MSDKTPPANHLALKLAVELAGGVVALAEICGCSKQNISRAVNSGAGLPARYCVNVEQALGLSRHVTRPDIFGPWKEAA
jgi:DNA-binding transcriptional regulator YdaS (Cro superfamily)